MSFKIIKDIAVDLCTNTYLEPYLRRVLTDDTADGDPTDDTASEPRAAVRIVTDDTASCADRQLDELCSRLSLPLAVIRCPYIVATGMQGLPRRIAEGIYRGSYVHIRGNEARISVVHGVDVARAVQLSAGIQGTYTLTDGTDPTIHDLSEAFAYRIDNKRIITLKPFWARLWYGRKYYDTLTADHVAQSTFTYVFPDFAPHSVVNYLRNHVYDQKSL